jgi:hypothetical protein
MKPFAALLIRAPLKGGYSDSCGVSVVTVLELDREQKRARVSSRCGGMCRLLWAGFDELASTPEEAAKKLQPHLSALAGRAALSAVPVQTPAEAVTEKQ